MQALDELQHRRLAAPDDSLNSPIVRITRSIDGATAWTEPPLAIHRSRLRNFAGCYGGPNMATRRDAGSTVLTGTIAVVSVLALTGCSLVLEGVYHPPPRDVQQSDATTLDSRTQDVGFEAAPTDARAMDTNSLDQGPSEGGSDVATTDRVSPPPDATLDGALDARPADVVAVDGGIRDGLSADDATIILDEAITLDGPVVPFDARTDVHVTACGVAVPPYSCVLPGWSTDCTVYQTALTAAYVAAASIPCCLDSDCDSITSANLCCPGEQVAISSPATQCISQILVAAATVGCPMVCTAVLCHAPTGMACGAGHCVPTAP